MATDTEWTQWDNGLCIASTTTPANGVMFSLWIRNGARHDPPGLLGLAHLYEHVLYAALESYAPVHAFLQDGARLNAQCGRELTAVYGQCLAEHAGPFIAHLIDGLLQADFNGWPLDREKRIIGNERDWLGQGGDDMEQMLATLAWPGHALSNPVLGNPGTLAHICLDHIAHKHQTLLHGNRLLFAACGQITHSQLTQALSKLRRLPTGDRPAQKAPVFAAEKKCFPGAQTLSRLVWLFAAPAYAHRDRLLCHWLVTLLTETTQYGLGYRMRQAGLNYAIQAEVHSYSDAGFWYIRSDCHPHDAHACRQQFERFSADVLEGRLPQQAFASAKQILLTRSRMDKDALQYRLEMISLDAIYAAGRPPDTEALFHTCVEEDLRRFFHAALACGVLLQFG